MMNHLRTTTAHDTNTALLNHLFFNEDKISEQFTSKWTMGDRDGSDFMKRHGYEVLSDSIEAYLDGKCTKHRYLHARVSNEQDGVSTMNANDCECLRQITTAKTNGAKHVMVLRAVRRNVLSKDVIQFACGAQRPVRPLAPEHKENTATNKDEGVAVMLVDTNDEKRNDTHPDPPKEDKSSASRAKKRRRKAAPEVPAADPSNSVDTTT